MFWLRGYLLTGLIAHKLLWEVLKRSAAGQSAERSDRSAPLSVRVLAIKAVKIAILAGLVAQTFLPDVLLPIRDDPNLVQGVGVAIYTLGWLVAVAGRIQLGKNWSNIETATVLGGQKVVDGGLYRHVRHPIYTGDLLLLLGLELALNSWLVLAVVALAPVVLAQAVREEKLLLVNLPGYREYCARTKRFIPYVV